MCSTLKINEPHDDAVLLKGKYPVERGENVRKKQVGIERGLNILKRKKGRVNGKVWSIARGVFPGVKCKHTNKQYWKK